MPKDLDSLLNAWLDGALPASQRKAVEKRLAEPAVARRLERLTLLRQGLSKAAPSLSPDASHRLWIGIRARVQAEVPAGPPWWEALLTRRWAPAWGLGLASGLAMAWAIFIRPLPTLPQRQPLLAPGLPVPVQAAAPAQRTVSGSRAATRPQASVAAAKLAPQAAAGVAQSSNAAAPVAPAQAAAAAAPASHGPTEVERALAENPVNDLMDQYLQATRPSGLRQAQAGAPGASRVEGGSLAGYNQVSAMEATPTDNAAAGAVQGGVDGQGFWNWGPAAVAMNQHRWNQVKAELDAAEAKAPLASERSFAASAMGLLAVPGAPLEGSVPPVPPVGDMRVLAAGRWQLQVANRKALFGQGVSVSLPGLRAESPSMSLDLTFDRASFGPGSTFTRVDGDPAAAVLDANDQPVTATRFSAPNGADYNVSVHALRLR